MFSELSLFTLSLSAFISATLLPGASEALLIIMLQSQEHHPGILVAVATIGNTLGSISTYFVGVLIAKGNFQFLNKRKQAIKPNHQALIQQWGAITLLLSWAPLIGDGLCLAAGFLRINPLAASSFILVGKFLRYGFLTLAWIYFS